MQKAWREVEWGRGERRPCGVTPQACTCPPHRPTGKPQKQYRTILHFTITWPCFVNFQLIYEISYSQNKYSKTCLIRHLCNPFPCVIRHWFSCSFDHLFMVFALCNLTPCLYRHKILFFICFLCFVTIFIQTSFLTQTFHTQNIHTCGSKS